MDMTAASFLLEYRRPILRAVLLAIRRRKPNIFSPPFPRTAPSSGSILRRMKQNRRLRAMRPWRAPTEPAFIAGPGRGGEADAQAWDRGG